MPNVANNRFSARKRLIVAAISACFSSAPAWANPTGPQVVNGNASFGQAGNLLTVTNTNGAIINWNSFSIGANETTRFNQVSAASSVLNRVIANDPSVLLGTLSSNGKVWLVNPAGILVGQGARIDVAGFIASTLNVRNEDFLAGRLNFGATPDAGSIQNYGQITTPSGGSVYLVAPNVENHGIINTPNGEAILAAGQTVQLIDTGTPGVTVDITGAEGNVTNLGDIVAEVGRVGMAGVLVRNSGTLNASSVVKEGGRIFLKASKDVILDSASQIKVDAEQSGKGGDVSVWAGGAARIDGSISAQGGSQSGDGGFIETSGAHVTVADSARISTQSPQGKTGTWLIDPNDFTIAASGGDMTGAQVGSALDSNDFVIQTATMGTAGNGDIVVSDSITKTGITDTTLTLSAERNIEVNTAISSSNSKLHVNLFSDADGAAGGAILMNTGSSITSNGGNVTLAGGVGGASSAIGTVANRTGVLLGGSTKIDAGGGDIVLRGMGYNDPFNSNNKGIEINGVIQTTGIGSVTIIGQGGDGTSSNYGIRMNSVVTTDSGDVTIAGTAGAGSSSDNHGLEMAGPVQTGSGSIFLTGSGGSGTTSNKGIFWTGSQATVTSTSGNISITGTGGAGTGDSNRGIELTAPVKTGGAGSITIMGTGGNAGTSDNYGVYISESVLTVDGAISITGIGHGSLTFNNGIRTSGAVLSTAGGVVTLNGTGGNGTDYNHGVYLEGSIVTGGGELAITGTGGGAGTANKGIYAYAATLDTSNSAGTGGVVNLTGTGGNGVSDNAGVYLEYSSVVSGGGTIDITGTGRGTGDWNYGIYTYNATLDSSNAAGLGGIVTLSGTGGSGGSETNGYNSGVYLDGWASSNEYTIIRTGGAALNITGTGGGTLSYNSGVFANDAELDTSGPDGSVGGSMTLQGTASGNGTGWYNEGVALYTGTAIRTAGGSLAITGDGGDGGEGRGVNISSATLDTSRTGGTGGTVTLTGTGGGANYGSDGVYMNGASVATGGANLDIVGTGGDGPSGNNGIYTWDSVLDTRNGSALGGIVTLNGTGGNGSGYNYGVDLAYFTSIATGGAGLSITGVGGATGASNYGIYVYSTFNLDTGKADGTGGADVVFNGTGGGSAGFDSNHGIYLYSTELASARDLTLNGIAGVGSASYDVYISGDVALRADSQGTGTGGVNLGSSGVYIPIEGGRADIYYNPASYTDAATKSDTSGDPYAGKVSGDYWAWMLVNDVNQLQAMNTNLAGKYALGRDIDATATANWNANQGFAPVGSLSTPFAGQFNGLERTVGDLVINRTSQAQVGLFGYVATGSTVKNVGIAGGSVSGSAAVGGLAGTNDGTIDGAFSTATVNGSSIKVGGLVGVNEYPGIISNSYSTGAVSGGSYVGGLVGNNDFGIIVSSYSSGAVTGVGDYVGGLVGSNTGGSFNFIQYKVSDSYALGNVSGGNYVGGLVGQNIGTIDRSYSTGAVFATNVNPSVGGLVGANTDTVTNSFWDTTTSGTATGIGYGTKTGATGMATADMMTQANFTSATAANGNVNPGWDFDYTWWMSTGNTRSFLRSERSATIRNAHQLQLMGADLTASYSLANDIDMQAELASGMWNTATGFVPVGGYSATTLPAYQTFAGRFDGMNHTISNLAINRPLESFVGLFGYLNYGAEVSNVQLTSSSISGGSYVGALAGQAYYSVIKNSHNTGDVSGSTNYVGGLVGRLYGGTISESHATGDVTSSGGGNVGGLVGRAENYFSIYDSYHSGSVTSIGGNSVGGLVGAADNSPQTIARSYAIGNVTGGNYVGGLVGYSADVSIKSSHAVGDVTGSVSVGGLVGFNDTWYSTSQILGSYATGTVSGDSEVGGLVGGNYGAIENSYSSSVVNATSNSAGGLVGYNDLGAIKNSYATGSVTGNINVGGLVGYNDDYYGTGAILDSYATGSVVGNDYVGGLAGQNFGSIDRAYSAGAVSASGGSSIGGLVGWDEMGWIFNSYWNTETSGQATSSGGGIGKTSGEMMQAATFSGWSIASASGSGATWRIYEGATAPLLRSFLKPLTVTANDASKAYDKVAFGGNGVTYSVPTATLSGAPTYGGDATSALNVGSYAIEVGGLYSDQQGYDISYAPGTLNITPRSLVVTAAGVNKVYDATANATVILGDNRLSGDLLTLAYGAANFNDSNVAFAKPVSVSGITLAGTNNYTLSNATATTSADITPANLTLSGVTAANKVYDGGTVATLTGGSLSGVIGDDAVGFTGAGVFADKNVGAGKAVNVSGVVLTGASAGNYQLDGATATTIADITVRPLSTWIGGATGNWSVASNWDALPDLSNVLEVTIPTGNTVTYDAATGTTNLVSLSAGGLAIAGGTLNIGNSLTVSTSFSQTGGTLGDFGAGSSASITQATGNLSLPQITVTNLSLNAPAGAITQSGPIAALTLNTQSQGATTLNNPGNQISDRVDMKSGGPLILWGSGDLNLGAIDAGTSTAEIKASGAILQAPGTDSGINLIAGSANLESTFGGASGGLAISANTQVTGALVANVGVEADFGGIRIQNTGTQPASVTLTDNALAGASVSFLNTGDISSTSGYTLKTLTGGDLALLSNGNIIWNGGSLATPTGSVQISADGSLGVTGALTSPVDLALSSTNSISVSGSVITQGTGTAALTAPSVSISGVVDSANNVDVIADTISLASGSSTSATQDVILAAADITATSATVSAGHDISAAVTGDLRLNSSGFTAGNDIFVNMLGTSSTLYLNDVSGLDQASFLWAQAPSTIFLTYAERASGGLIVDGVATDAFTYVSAAGGSGLFYGPEKHSAVPGDGLQLTFVGGLPPVEGTPEEPDVASAVIAAVNATTTSTEERTATLPVTFDKDFGTLGGPGESDHTIGGTEGSFGGDEEDEKKTDAGAGSKKEAADKPAKKKLSTCS